MITWELVVFLGQAPRRRGRPMIGDKPMTSTERNRRRMARLKKAEADLKELKSRGRVKGAKR